MPEDAHTPTALLSTPVPIFTAGGLARTRPLVAGSSDAIEAKGGDSRLNAKAWSSSRRQSACSSQDAGRAVATPGSTVSGSSWAKIAPGVASPHPVATGAGWWRCSEGPGGLALELPLLAPAGLNMTPKYVSPFYCTNSRSSRATLLLLLWYKQQLL